MVELRDCDAMVFDCDGVLVDSETIANEVLREVIGELGWAMSQDQAHRTFVGHALPDTVKIVTEHFAAQGDRPDASWVETYRARRDAELAARLSPMHGVAGMLAAALRRFKGRVGVASNSPRGKLDMQLRRTALDEVFHAAHVFSGMDMPQPKPAPDVYRAAAASFDPPSRRFAVLEDSPSGVKAGVAAGGYVIGLSTVFSGADLRAAGAHRVVASLPDAAELLRP
ncbi:HAD family phosphatase [Brevibacterium sp. 50QC2O2]|uniref:HAD family hydrolase n=1 Tax=Brevibacterium TaxID=1696 RepID=UPI00211C3F4D|nr:MULTISPECIES: HAD family phosphatase [unclassified Brevibacterium]MCQ9366890.1 HAD family phosphatase [Brevibacterium sp. 91QC2O2]MCQ9384040.1 HAD family phosphatase [Brevibacterium sp. 68QC2CO]MCQ9389106.1 HAD family phosphatase [Brevibacterium sp. 50QC2O2]